MVRKNLNEAIKDSIIRQNESLNKGIVDVAKKYILLQPGTVINSDSTYYAFIGTGLQRIDYSYNIRGNLRGINLWPTDRLDSSKIFALKLDYFEDGRYYDGNLSRQSWKTQQDTTTRRFLYGYDKASRITSAYYAGKGAENYSLSNIAYDANGNIKRLSRKGFISAGTWGNVDSLSYTYTGTGIPSDVSNRLFNVHDVINPSIGVGDFKNNAVTSIEYFYYDDGSLKADLNKGIDSIKYNYLGLPTRIYFDPDKYIENIYTADGVKLAQRIVNGATAIQNDYIGDLLYKNDTLISILHDEGKIRFDTSGNVHYQYFITDHLGNTRVIFEKINDSTYVAQENHYGAWGEVLQGIGTQGDWKFLFQGKEFVDAFAANYYDFHSRMYDPTLGRMLQVDGANQFASGYVGMGNMPTIGVDPDGQAVHILVGAAIGAVVNLAGEAIKGNIHSFKQGLLAFGMGAVAGGLAAATGGASLTVGQLALQSAVSQIPGVNVNLGGGFNLSISPALMMGTQGNFLGANLGLGYTNGNLSLGVSSSFAYGQSNITCSNGWTSSFGGGIAFDNGNFTVLLVQ